MHKSELSNKLPSCVFCAIVNMESGQSCAMHSHACTEIVWYIGGSGSLIQAKERMDYESGYLSIYQPGMQHRDECKEASSQLCVGVHGGGAGDLPAGMWETDSATISVLSQMQNEISHSDAWSKERLHILTQWLLLELKRQLVHTADTHASVPKQVQKARNIIDTRYAEVLTISGIASECFANPDYLRQLFVEWVGEAPMRYLIRKRIEVACDLLRLNQDKTAAIAARVGIANPFYFSRLFRQHMGKSPKQYRSEHKG